MRTAIICIALGALAACDMAPNPAEDTSAAYTPPEASGLVAVRPYPTEGDVCQVIGENDLTNELLDHTATLIGCPYYETGAIADLRDGGGVPVGRIGDWALFSVPD